MTCNRIREIMKYKGVSSSSLAERLEMSVSGVNQNIVGNPSIKVLERFAAALDVPLWQLFISPEQLEEEREKKRKGFSAIIKDGTKCYTADNWEEVCDLYIKHKNGSLV